MLLHTQYMHACYKHEFTDTTFNIKSVRELNFNSLKHIQNNRQCLPSQTCPSSSTTVWNPSTIASKQWILACRNSHLKREETWKISAVIFEWRQKSNIGQKRLRNAVGCRKKPADIFPFSVISRIFFYPFTLPKTHTHSHAHIHTHIIKYVPCI